MKQAMFTTRESRRIASVDDVPADVDTSCPRSRARIGSGLSQPAPPGMQSDMLVDEITGKALAAMLAAYELEAEHGSMSPFDEDGCGTFFEPAPAMLTVLRAAVQVEPDPVEAGYWYRRTCIEELGRFTAAQLVALGRSDEVVGFLLSVRDGKRD